MKAKFKKLSRTIFNKLKKIYIAIFYHDNYASIKFKKIYANNAWKSKESVSGLGSELRNTEAIRKQIPLSLEKLQVKTLLDAPCGDFNWMKELELSGVDYIGGDIVAELINNNNAIHSSQNKIFRLLDITKDPLPKADIMLTRDCLVHLSYGDINNFLCNLKNSAIEYILTTTFTERQNNADIITGSWRPINLALAPFIFPKPIMLISEKCQEDEGSFPDKALALYKVKDLPNALVGY